MAEWETQAESRAVVWKNGVRYAAKVDVQHKFIRDGLRQAGIFVLDLSKAGKGCPDFLCHARHTGWVPIEVKSAVQVTHRKKDQPLTTDQQKLHRQAPIPIVETLDEALHLFGL